MAKLLSLGIILQRFANETNHGNDVTLSVEDEEICDNRIMTIASIVRGDKPLYGKKLIEKSYFIWLPEGFVSLRKEL